MTQRVCPRFLSPFVPRPHLVRFLHRGSGIEYVAKDESGFQLLQSPLYNKGSAFTAEERLELGLTGCLPPKVETMQQQLDRVFDNFQAESSDLLKHVFLRDLQVRASASESSLIQLMHMSHVYVVSMM